MKRRELFGSLSAFPLAVVIGSEAKSSESKLPMGDQLYHVVYVFDHGAVDFRLAGIYSLETDAIAQLERIKKLEMYMAGHLSNAGVTQANHSWLENFFVSARLGDMKEVLERIEKLVPKT